MGNRKTFLLIALFISVSFGATAQVRRYINNDGRYQRRASWSQQPHSKGLFSSTDGSGIVLTIEGGATYYYGDVEFPGLALFGGVPSDWASAHMSFYGKLSLMMPVYNHLGVRINLTGGKLQANNFEYQSAPRSQKEFSSFFAEPSATVEYYPFSEVSKWFYIYAGLGITYSYIDCNHFATVDGTFHKLSPTVPFGIGVNFPVAYNFRIGINLGCHQTLFDSYFSSLDGYPFKSPEGEVMGKKSRWADGYFTGGITLSYVFKNKACKICRFTKYQ